MGARGLAKALNMEHKEAEVGIFREVQVGISST